MTNLSIDCDEKLIEWKAFGLCNSLEMCQQFNRSSFRAKDEGQFILKTKSMAFSDSLEVINTKYNDVKVIYKYPRQSIDKCLNIISIWMIKYNNIISNAIFFHFST